MRELRPGLIALLLALLGLVIQATLFRRFDWLTPDLVVLVVCVAALTLTATAELLLGFFAGALVDVSIASSVLGLRSFTYTVVAYLAIRSKSSAESGFLAVGVWVAVLTLISVVVLLVVGITFGQSGELGNQITRRLLQVPLSNFVVAALLAVPMTRLLQRSRDSI
jgi:rod shape-determining protein MreD